MDGDAFENLRQIDANQERVLVWVLIIATFLFSTLFLSLLTGVFGSVYDNLARQQSKVLFRRHRLMLCEKFLLYPQWPKWSWHSRPLHQGERGDTDGDTTADDTELRSETSEKIVVHCVSCGWVHFHSRWKSVCRHLPFILALISAVLSAVCRLYSAPVFVSASFLAIGKIVFSAGLLQRPWFNKDRTKLRLQGKERLHIQRNIRRTGENWRELALQSSSISRTGENDLGPPVDEEKRSLSRCSLTSSCRSEAACRMFVAEGDGGEEEESDEYEDEYDEEYVEKEEEDVEYDDDPFKDRFLWLCYRADKMDDDEDPVLKRLKEQQQLLGQQLDNIQKKVDHLSSVFEPIGRTGFQLSRLGNEKSTL